MGANFNYSDGHKIGKDAFAVVKAEGESIINHAAYMSGHGGYTGSFAECRGVEVVNQIFDSSKDAEEWLLDNARKWGPLVAVRYRVEGGIEWAFGAWCSS
jgi:hypothetical protein